MRPLFFTAQRVGSSGRLSWQVTSDLALVGFHVYRQEPKGDRVQISEHLVTGREHFEFLDLDPPAGPADYWLSEIDRDGSVSWLGPVRLGTAAPEVPQALTCAPNPFSKGTRISYVLMAPARVRIDVFDARGALVRGLLDSRQDVGEQSVSWSGTDAAGHPVPAGVYMVRATRGGESEVTRVVRVH